MMLLLWHAAAAKPVTDAGIAVEVQGEVEWRLGGSGRAEPLPPWSKVRVGDRIDLPAASELQLVYYHAGRRETWAGPVSLLIGETESNCRRCDQEPGAVGAVPASLGRAVAEIPAIVSRPQSRAGMTLVRGASSGPVVPLSAQEQAKLAESRAAFEEWSATASPGDVLPQLAFAATLLGLEQHAEAVSVLEGAVEACKGCAAAADLLSFARR